MNAAGARVEDGFRLEFRRERCGGGGVSRARAAGRPSALNCAASRQERMLASIRAPRPARARPRALPPWSCRAARRRSPHAASASCARARARPSPSRVRGRSAARRRPPAGRAWRTSQRRSRGCRGRRPPRRRRRGRSSAQASAGGRRGGPERRLRIQGPCGAVSAFESIEPTRPSSVTTRFGMKLCRW